MVAVVAVVGLVLSGCGSDTKTPSAAVTVAASFNDADVEFAQGMIAHHEQAIEMAEIALDPKVGVRAEVADLATRIKGEQDPEIELMTGWLTQWNKTIVMDTSAGHDMASMEGMMTAESMNALGLATGAEFDTMWLTMMIDHHKGAVSQATDVRANGSSPDVIALADRIIAAQQGEIAEMQQLLGA